MSKHPDPIEVQVAKRLEGGWIANTGRQPVGISVSVDLLWGDGEFFSTKNPSHYDWSIPYRYGFAGEPELDQTILYWRPYAP